MSEAAENVVAKVSTIGKYRLIASLGQGGMAKVYLALMAGPAGFNKLLVIKALRDDMRSAGEEFVAMFLDEARLAARLNHPNVVQTYEVGEAEGRFFIAMEYLEGQALRTVQRRTASQGGLPVEEQLRVLADTARGLHYAHELKSFNGDPLNVVHRDVSPQNIFLTYDGQVKLLDFGIAKTQDAEHMTKVGVIKGKVDYIAPEQIRGEGLDRRADIFALGAMMWEALTDQRFAGGPKVADITKIHNRVTAAEPKLTDVAPDTPAKLVEICQRAIALDPEERYATGEDFANALDAYLATAEYRPTSKTLGALVAPAFKVERDKLRSLIEKQVQLVKAGGPRAFSQGTGALPKLDPALSRTGSGVWETGHTASGSLPDLSQLSSNHTQTGASHVGPMPTGSRGVPKGVALVLVGAAMAAAAFLGTRSDSDPEKARSTGSATSPQVEMANQVEAQPATPTTGENAPAEKAETKPAPTAAALNTVHIRVEVSPSHAEAKLDGANLPSLPFEANLAKDGKLHELSVHAPGFDSVRQVLTFDRDQHVSLRLRPARRRRSSSRGSSSAASSAPAAEAAPTPTPEAPEAPAKPKRQQVVAPGQSLIGSSPRRTPASPKIDVEDPYQ